MFGCVYLNNSGTKWITDRARKGMYFILIQNGIEKKRKADYYEQFGNFATINFRVKGIRYSKFPESESKNGLPVIEIKNPDHYSTMR